MNRIALFLLALSAAANIGLVVLLWIGWNDVRPLLVQAASERPIGFQRVVIEGYVKLDPATKVGLYLPDPLLVKPVGRIGVDVLNNVSVIVPDPVAITTRKPLPVTVAPY